MNTVTNHRAGISVSVIIPCFNGAKTIVECLQSLERQQTTFDTEVVVVDSSTDETPELVKTHFPKVRLIHFSERHSCGMARNVGLKSTSSDIVLFIDSDCTAPSNWVQSIAEQLTTDGADAVCGAMGNGTADSITGTIGYYLEFFRFLPHQGAPHSTRWLIGGTSGFRRSVIEGFEYSDISLGDDFLMSYQLKSEGASLVMIPSVAITHLNRTGFKTVFDYQKKIGAAASQYRAVTDRQLMDRLARFPFLALLAPLVIIPWVGSHVLFKLGLKEFLKYILYSPVCLIMSAAWTSGFVKGLRQNPSTGSKGE